MHYIYKIKKITIDETKEKPESVVTVGVLVSEKAGDKAQGEKPDIIGTFLGPVPRETVENWLKSTVEPSDTVEIQIKDADFKVKSVEKPLKAPKKSK